MIGEIEKAQEILQKLQAEFEKLKEDYINATVSNLNVENIDRKEFECFLKEPFLIVEKGKNKWYILVPSFIPFQVGAFLGRKDGFNVFEIDVFTQFMSEIPESLRDKLSLPKRKDYKVKDNVFYYPSELIEEVKRNFGDKLENIREKSAKIKPGGEIELIRKIIRGGTLPFVPLKVSEEDLREYKGGEFEINQSGEYIFHKEAWDEFIKNGAILLLWPTGTGKDIFSVYALSRIDVEGKPNLYLAPTRTILEQIENAYIPTYAPQLEKDIKEGKLILATYNSVGKLTGRDYGLVIFGECHRLPANTFIKLGLISVKYRIGQSATPWREDDRTDLMYALTGKPVGQNWKELLEILGKKLHVVNVHIVKKQEDKIKMLKKLYDANESTLIFVWRLKLGKEISRKLGVPFVHGKTKNRMKILNENKRNVISSVGSMGISLKNIERIIEIDWQGGRADIIQRVGRLSHSIKDDAVFEMIYTREEYRIHLKRILVLMEKGYTVNFFGENVPIPEIQIGRESVKTRIGEQLEKDFKKYHIDNERILGDEYSNNDIENRKNFVMKQEVREVINRVRKESSQKRIVEGIIGILVRDGPTDYYKIQEELGLTHINNISMAATMLERGGIIKKSKDGKKAIIELDLENIMETIKGIRQTKEKREELKGILEEIFE